VGHLGEKRRVYDKRGITVWEEWRRRTLVRSWNDIEHPVHFSAQWFSLILFIIPFQLTARKFQNRFVRIIILALVLPLMLSLYFLILLFPITNEADLDLLHEIDFYIDEYPNAHIPRLKEMLGTIFN
jgi:hypothetical protein